MTTGHTSTTQESLFPVYPNKPYAFRFKRTRKDFLPAPDSLLDTLSMLPVLQMHFKIVHCLIRRPGGVQLSRAVMTSDARQVLICHIGRIWLSCCASRAWIYRCVAHGAFKNVSGVFCPESIERFIEPVWRRLKQDISFRKSELTMRNLETRKA